jgi:hypothetical protein
VTALMMDIATESTSHVLATMAPNMCITPAAPSPLPLPYPNIGNTGKLDPGCEKVVIGSSKKSMNLKSKIAKINGNEAGTQKDITTAQTNGKAWVTVGAFTVLFEGAPVAFTGSIGFSNSM